jgi:hypothetical protein
LGYILENFELILTLDWGLAGLRSPSLMANGSKCSGSEYSPRGIPERGQRACRYELLAKSPEQLLAEQLLGSSPFQSRPFLWRFLDYWTGLLAFKMSA